MGTKLRSNFDEEISCPEKFDSPLVSIGLKVSLALSEGFGEIFLEGKFFVTEPMLTTKLLDVAWLAMVHAHY